MPGASECHRKSDREGQRDRQLRYKTNTVKCQGNHLRSRHVDVFWTISTLQNINFFYNKTLGEQEVPRMSLPAQKWKGTKERMSLMQGWKHSPLPCPFAQLTSPGHRIKLQVIPIAVQGWEREKSKWTVKLGPVPAKKSNHLPHWKC